MNAGARVATRYHYPIQYEDLDHTADVGVIVYGEDAEAVLARLVLAFSDLLTGGGPLAEETQRELRVPPGDRAAMAVDVVRELLYVFDRERVIPASCEVVRFDEASGTELEVGMGRYDEVAHAEGTELKAVTFHEAKVERADSGWRGQLVFDV
jgi:SHS2 domain-containing protein